MGVIECGGDGASDLERLLQRQLPLALQALPQGLPLHEGHHVVEQVPGLAGVVQWDDVGMLQPCRDLDLAQEAVGAEAERQVGMQHFDGHRPVVPHVLRQVDGRHAAAPDLAFDGVAVDEGASQTV